VDWQGDGDLSRCNFRDREMGFYHTTAGGASTVGNLIDKPPPAIPGSHLKIGHFLAEASGFFDL